MSEFKFKPLACGFHSHTHFSLDSAGVPELRIQEASRQGRIADCVTDHGVMSGILPHYMASKKMYKDKKIEKPIKSIHGIEAYIIDEDRPWKEFKNGKKEPNYYHLTIHFKTAEAYLYFCKLTPKMEERAIIKYGERKPLMYISELEPVSGQIIIGSGCLLSPIQKNVLSGRSDIARSNYIKLRSIAGKGNFFVEVMPHCIDHEWVKPKRDSHRKIIEEGKFIPIDPSMIRRDADAIDSEPCLISPGIGIDIQKNPNEFAIKMAKEFGDPIIISLDDHFARPEHKALQEMRMGNGTEDWKFYNSYHMLTSDEAATILQKQLGVSDRDIEEWIDNSYLFVDQFKDYKLITNSNGWQLPNTETIYGIKLDPKEKLFELIEKHGKMKKPDDKNYQVYKDRLDYEISVMSENGTADFLPYVLLLEDLAEECKRKGQLVNLRGSGCGSLLYYLIGMSITDPIKYNLPFERHLTLGRIKSGALPDADVDFENRDFGVSYVREKYKENFALIATDVGIKIKTAILDTVRSIKGEVDFDTMMMCKKIPNMPQGFNTKDFLYGKTDKETGEYTPGYLEIEDGRELLVFSKQNPEVWKTIETATNITKTRGVHPGGVIISPVPVNEFLPVIKNKENIVTAYNMKGVEEVGGVKYDFLTVDALEAISVAFKSIKEMEGKEYTWDELPHDPKVYEEIIHKGKLVGLFQINTSTMRPYVIEMKPKNIVEISNILALVRPGALDAKAPDPDFKGSAADYYKAAVNGKVKVKLIHEDLHEIFGDTYGINLFQEQTLQVFRDLAGYTYETAEGVRRGVAKKERDVLEKHMGALRDSCLSRGWTINQCNSLVESLMASSNYSFNRGHSTSYAIVCYNMAYLKYHHPMHFWKGMLTTTGGDEKKLKNLLSECGHLILPVDINKSDPQEWLIEGDKIRPPLLLLKGCGEKGVINLHRFIKLPLDEYMNNAQDEEEEKKEVENELE